MRSLALILPLLLALALVHDADAQLRPGGAVRSGCVAEAEVSSDGAGTRASGAPAVLLGRVTGKHGAPLHGAQVYLSGSASGTLTDSAGSFRLVVPPEWLAAPGSVGLGVARIGFEPLLVPVALTAGDSVRLALGLCPAPVRVRPTLVIPVPGGDVGPLHVEGSGPRPRAYR